MLINESDATSATATRDRVRLTLAQDGPVTAADLAAGLGLTPAAVRRHLDALTEQNAIEEYDPALGEASNRGRGRPARAYVLTEAGHAGLEHHYDEMAASALRFLAQHAGADAVAAFARERANGLVARYSARVASADDNAAARAEALAAALTADGFAASIRPADDGLPVPSQSARSLPATGLPATGLPATAVPTLGMQLCQGHCPVRHVATEFPAICDAETEAFSRLLGVPVERVTTMANGEHLCRTVVPLDGPAP
ncbi:MAG: helix-turn-helix domain-containing protein [Cryobacterium sp.]|uniref:helix-turn-helix transcriptional regulator n=1 Tax=unclassified Cryobacterium TaxID=2649013 RepID=UPI001A2AF02F|nr:MULTISPECIES: helix-turn-helix domain-containing protein [unclassified Cryobacterium]MCY7403463.1 helix-turn-helix domain-containing protein [Cryobacterium sp.]MEC5152736.1 putative ArsR family transcriptional regulator [Cryobacterium sp. CAN_C3]